MVDLVLAQVATREDTVDTAGTENNEVAIDQAIDDEVASLATQEGEKNEDKASIVVD